MPPAGSALAGAAGLSAALLLLALCGPGNHRIALATHPKAAQLGQPSLHHALRDEDSPRGVWQRSQFHPAHPVDAHRQSFGGPAQPTPAGRSHPLLWVMGSLLAALAAMGLSAWPRRIATWATTGTAEDIDPTWEAEAPEDLPEEEDLVPFEPSDPVFAPDEGPAVEIPIPTLLDRLRAGADAEKAEALRALRSVATDPMGRLQLLRSEGVPHLLAAARYSVGPAQVDAAHAVARLAVLRDGHPVLCTAGVFDVLLPLAETGNPDVQIPVLAALTCLSETDALKTDLVRRGVVDLLLRLLQTTTGDVQHWVVTMFGTLAFSTSSDVQRPLRGAIGPLVRLLDGATPDDARCGAAKALALFAFQNEDLQWKVCEARPVPALVAMLRQGTEVGKASAAGALAALATGDRANDIAAAGGNEALLEYVRGSAGHAQVMALRALIFVALLPVNAEALVAAGGVETLAALLNEGSDEARSAAVLALAQVAAREVHLPRIAASGVLPAVLPLRTSNDEQVSAAAMQIAEQLRDYQGR